MGNFKGWEILVILVLLLVLFGAKRLPDAARGLGRSLRIFKSEIKEMRDEDAPAAAPVKRETPPAAPPALETRPATTDEAPARAPEPEVRER
jgi:sec-independent protein translocase protein TatA